MMTGQYLKNATYQEIMDSSVVIFSYNSECVKISDQPAYPLSLVRVFQCPHEET